VFNEAHNQMVITSADPVRHPYRATYSYQLSGNTLVLRAVNLTDPSETPAQLGLDREVLDLYALAPFTKIA
jgi:hypothetical protein